MIERSHLELKKDGESKGLEITLKKEIVIPRTNLGYEEKSFIFFDQNGVERSYLTRRVELFCLPTLIGFNYDQKLTYADPYLEAWKILKERGFLVVDEVWKINDDKVATTNLVEKGGSVYDQKIDAVIERDPLEMDRELIRIPIKEISKVAEGLFNLANKNGVELMSDGPFHIVIRPDKSWYILPLDLGKIRIHSRPRDISSDSKKDNSFYINRALNAFSRIQQNIKALRQARGLEV